MQEERSSRFRNASWRKIRIATAALLLALSFFSIDQAFHRALHEDAGDPGHSCFLTLFAQGQLEVFLEAPYTGPAPVPTCGILDRLVQPSGDLDFLLPPSCGPPVTA